MYNYYYRNSAPGMRTFIGIGRLRPIGAAKLRGGSRNGYDFKRGARPG